MAKAAIVLLVDPTVHNFMRRLSLRLYNEFGLGFRAARLPPHITLKQPFHTSRLPPLERYFDGLAAELEPIPITLERLEFKTGEVMGEENGILWLAVAENPTLRGLHARINRELAARFERTEAAFDGPDYAFHATVETGTPIEVYRQAYQACKELPVGLAFVADRLMLAYSPAADDEPDDFISYRCHALGRVK